VHCGPWRCLSGMASPSAQCPEHTGKPTRRFRSEGIRCNDSFLDVIARGAFEGPQTGMGSTSFDPCQHHAARAFWAARPFSGTQ
jgi:hypothetical protein